MDSSTGVRASRILSRAPRVKLLCLNNTGTGNLGG